ncbi:DUF6891 domain-containing protein [Actinocorallia sp. A-T 12471]|uniref:DUF6891 domain-containing protein n=1 Tax=Actinocorallia sp. A-T 12471 TaxID=3089813 RepID=UPI0029CCCEBB|nr:hypothetical protein [Actinocorallia sp. A-T 12471]MDX6740536.1 hypothetical protein [Actinocorallia sp. A-T 12471]
MDAKERETTAREIARTHVEQGFDGVAQIVEQVLDHIGDGPDDLAFAEDVVEAVWRERLAEQRDWPEVTDPDRILRAFAALTEAGVTARAHFTCCQGCGTAEIGDAAAPDARGYVFFHYQDTESAAANARLHLSYGSFHAADEDLAIGHEVVAALTAEGLTPEWDGTIRKRIALTSLTWQKRLPPLPA